jgi:hypothetical protein
MSQAFVLCVTAFEYCSVLAVRGSVLEQEFGDCSSFLEDWDRFPFESIPEEKGLYVWEGSAYLEKDEDGVEDLNFNGQFRCATAADLKGFGLLE